MNETEYIRKIKELEELRYHLLQGGKREHVTDTVGLYRLTDKQMFLLVSLLCKAETGLAYPSLAERFKLWRKERKANV